MSAGLVAGIAILMMLFGFLLGTRSRQILAAAKLLSEAVRMLLCSLSIPAAAVQLDASSAESGKDDNLEEEEATAAGSLEHFLSTEQDSAFDDHPDLELNPVLIHRCKVAKERQRDAGLLEQRRQLLEAEGLSVEEIYTRLVEMKDEPAGGQRTDEKPSAISVLIAHGLSLNSSASSGGVEAAAIDGRRRQQRNVELFLRRDHGIVTERSKGRTRDARGTKLVSASDVARASKTQRFGGAGHERAERNVVTMRAGRNLMRQWKESNDQRMAARGEADPSHWDDGSDEEEREGRVDKVGRRRQRGGAKLNETELLKLAAELKVEMSDGDDDFEQSEDEVQLGYPVDETPSQWDALDE